MDAKEKEVWFYEPEVMNDSKEAATTRNNRVDTHMGLQRPWWHAWDLDILWDEEMTVNSELYTFYLRISCLFQQFWILAILIFLTGILNKYHFGSWWNATSRQSFLLSLLSNVWLNKYSMVVSSSVDVDQETSPAGAELSLVQFWLMSFYHTFFGNPLSEDPSLWISGQGYGQKEDIICHLPL